MRQLSLDGRRRYVTSSLRDDQVDGPARADEARLPGGDCTTGIFR